MSTTAEFRLPIFQRRFSFLRGERTQAEFAAFLELSRPTVGLYEAGQRVPDAITLKAIAEKCSVSADYLLGLTAVESRNLDVRKICELTGLSSGTVNFLKDIRSSLKQGRASFSSAFADQLFSPENERVLLEAESAVIQAALIQHFKTTENFKGTLEFSADDLSGIYIRKAEEQLQEVIKKALNGCVNALIQELENEQQALIQNGIRPDGDFQELAYGTLIRDSDKKAEMEDHNG